MKLDTKDKLEGAIVRSALQLPVPLMRRLAGPHIVKRGRALDMQVQLALTLNRLAGKPHSHELTVPQARRATEITAAQMVAPRPFAGTIRDSSLGGRPVRIYRPTAAEPNGPAVLYFHGGGFVIGSLDSHDAPCRELAARTPCTVISVDYRLAPEHAFPAAPDDCLRVFRALVKEAGSLGVDPERIAIGGDSAGGNLAAVLAIDTRSDETRPCFQLLVYPGTDLTMSFPSIDEMGTGFFLERDTMAWFCDHYLAGADPRDPRASPWFAEDLTHLPPALVITAGFDPLRDEGDAYAKRLRDAGVVVAHHQHPTLFHGFWNTTTVMREAERAFDEAVGVLRAAIS